MIYVEQRIRKSLRSKDGPIQSWAHNPKVVSSNLTPATISLSARPESWIPAFFLQLAAGYSLGHTQPQGSRPPLPLSTVHINDKHCPAVLLNIDAVVSELDRRRQYPGQ